MKSSAVVRCAESGWLPNPLIRVGIRRLLRARLREQNTRAPGHQRDWIESLRASPIAIRPDLANAQHYEVPSAFFDLVLGPHRKYSSAWWSAGERDLGRAEAAMLAKTCERAQMVDGASLLDLGCGWGSLSLWAAAEYPASRILAVSNSKSQRESILRRAETQGLRNLEVVTADINEFEPDLRFDRVVSVEMFEHLRNWESLLERIASWLTPEGRVFLHYFCHRDHAYPYEDRGNPDWMARHFFSGGMMPSERLIEELAGPLAIERRWSVSGSHYQKTSEAWLRNLNAERRAVLEIFSGGYGPSEAARWVQRWSIFFLACAELFGYRGGTEWRVAHVRLAAETAS